VQLAIFDVDGTLADTKQVDEACFAQAMAEAFGMPGVSGLTDDYVSSTDPGIATEAYSARYERPPTAADLSRLHERFICRLAGRAADAPHLFATLPGAAEALRRLRQEPDWAVAIATGSWEASGRLKLRAAGIDVEGIPAAFADDLPTREAIIERAIRLSEKRHGPFARTVYVGDGVWDVRAARRLGIAFLGVAPNEHAQSALHNEGASHIIRDYTDFGGFVRALDDANVPQRA